MNSASIMQNIFSTLVKPVLFSLILVLFGTGFSVAAEIDDSSLFVEAFSAYQKKDYLLAVEKIGIINQLFPDTPLQDVVLLLLARSSLRSGDNDLAAKTIIRFNRDFAANPLKTTIEAELQNLGSRWQKGERLLPVIPLRNAARKVRNEQMALERSTAEKIAQERLLKEIAEQERITLEKTETKRRKQEGRPASERAAQEVARASINITDSVKTIGVGQRGVIPFEVVNLGKFDADLILETNAPPDYETTLAVTGSSDAKLLRLTIAPASPLKGSILLRMPLNKVDGHKATISLRAVSEKQHQVIQTRETQIITAAPLIRVVAKTEKQKLAPGERTRYRVTVLNVGTLPALGMSVRVLLPAQIEFLGGSGSPYLRDPAGGISFRLDSLPTGKLAEFTMEVKVRADTSSGQELRSQIEVMHDQLPAKDIFTSTATMVQADPLQSPPLIRP